MVSHTHNRMEAGERTHDGRSLTELVKELRDEGTLLLRQEVALAKTEMSEKVDRIVPNLASMATGGGMILCGAFILLLAAVVGVYVFLTFVEVPNRHAGWIAPLVVGGIVAGIGYAMVQGAISKLKREPLAPERTIESLREDKEWVQAKVKS